MAAAVLATWGRGDGSIRRGPAGFRHCWPRRIHFWQRGGLGQHERGDPGRPSCSCEVPERESDMREIGPEEEEGDGDGRGPGLGSLVGGSDEPD